MLVGRDNNTLVGFGQIAFSRKEITGVHVLPSRARSGIGSQLVTALEKAGTDFGLREIVIQSSQNAVSFYEACGYVFQKDIEFQCQNGEVLSAQFMQKCLLNDS